VILDHGDGFTTEYAGLAPKSIAVREGALVQAGWRLGASTQSLFSFEPGFVYSMCAQSGCDTVPRFAELGEDGFLDEGEVVARAPAASAPVFRADSRVGETTFLENGIQSASGVPAHAFHVAEHYSIQGELDGSESRVAFVARRRGQAQPSVRVSGIVHEGTFSLSVCLADRRKDLADGAWEWALTAAAEHVTTSHWEPLTLLW
jgi:hypothetical protein